MLHKFARHIPALSLGLMLAACTGAEPEAEPAVATMRLTVGTQTIDVADNGAVTPAAGITISANTNLTATFLKADGSAETLVTADEFELRVTPANAALVTFTRSGAFAGTLNRLASGSTQLSVELFHLIEQHEDLGPFNVPITVQ
jgi:hypothetical protein